MHGLEADADLAVLKPTRVPRDARARGELLRREDFTLVPRGELGADVLASAADARGRRRDGLKAPHADRSAIVLCDD